MEAHLRYALELDLVQVLQSLYKNVKALYHAIATEAVQRLFCSDGAAQSLAALKAV